MDGGGGRDRGGGCRKRWGMEQQRGMRKREREGWRSGGETDRDGRGSNEKAKGRERGRTRGKK